MNDLLKSIIALYKSATGVTLRGLTPGGMWLGQAPETSSGAYIILTPLGAPIEYAMGDVYTVEALVQFLACSSSTALEVATVANSIRSLYKDRMLDMDSHRMFYARPQDSGMLLRDMDSEGYSEATVLRFLVGNK